MSQLGDAASATLFGRMPRMLWRMGEEERCSHFHTESKGRIKDAILIVNLTGFRIAKETNLWARWSEIFQIRLTRGKWHHSICWSPRLNSKERSKQQHVLLSASWCGQVVKSHLILLPPYLLCQGRLDSQMLNQNKPFLHQVFCPRNKTSN